MNDDDQTIQTIIDRQVRKLLTEMDERTPREREALAGAVEKLLRAKPLAGDSGFSLLDILKQAESGPRADD